VGGFLGICLLVSFACVFLFSGQASAAINPQINFQGKLTNTDGTNVADSTYSVVFSLYSVGSGGSAVWTETQGSVATTSGVFRVALGSVTTLPGSVDFNSASIYLGIKVGADAEMTPRIQFTAAPYAFNSDKLGGLTSAAFVQLSPGSQQTGNINVSGNVTAGGTYNGNTFSSSTLQFSAASAASLVAASGQNFSVDSGSSGTVAVGTTNATAITLGKAGAAVNTPGGLTINSGTTVPTADQVAIDNTSSTGVTTAGINGLSVKYKGGAAAIESSGLRVDYTPGTSSGGTWSGMRVVAGPTGAVAGVTEYGIKLEGPTTPGAGAEEGLYVGSGWDIGLDIASGGIQMAAQADPGTPASGQLRIYAKTIAGRVLPKWIGPSGVDTPFQASFGFNRVAMVMPAGGATLTSFGTTSTNVGTISNPAPASTNLFTSIRRFRDTSAALGGSLASHYQTNLMAWRGNAAGLGGFFYTTRFGLSTLQSGNRGFWGLADVTSAPTNVDPTTATAPGKLGIAINANSGNLKWVNNTTGSAPTVADLGASFPVNTTDLYELIIYSAPNSSSITYRVKDITTGSVTSDTTVSTNIPANTTFLAPQMWMTNNATAAAVAWDSGGWYLESDN
jgi:hypothetical protein